MISSWWEKVERGYLVARYWIPSGHMSPWDQIGEFIFVYILISFIHCKGSIFWRKTTHYCDTMFWFQFWCVPILWHHIFFSIFSLIWTTLGRIIQQVKSIRCFYVLISCIWMYYFKEINTKNSIWLSFILNLVSFLSEL